jgi:hypothetical protein
MYKREIIYFHPLVPIPKYWTDFIEIWYMGTNFNILLPLAPPPLVRPWPPPQSSIYPSPIQLNWSPLEVQSGRISGGFSTFSFLQGRVVAPRPTPTLEDQASVFISPRGRVAQLYPQARGTHFSRLLRHAWVTVGLFLFPGHHTGKL